jgi:manganese transport protein
VACDLAEVLGSAVGLNLLFGIPVLWAVLITGTDVLLLLAFQRLGMRKLEAFILVLIGTIGICFLVEIFLSQPSISGIASGFVPRVLAGEELYVAIGILGATVMPHNLYLHSALVQSRDVTRSRQAVAEACKYNLVDSAVAMNFAFFINAAILIVAAATFWSREIVVTEIQQAHGLLDHTLGTRVAPVAFAVALICAGQSSTLTGTLAGQITMEGFLRFRIRPWLRRFVTRLMAIVPAVAVIWVMRERGVYKLLILSQVILSLQLAFAVVPLIKFTSSKQKMGPFVSRWWVQGLAWGVAGVIVVLNGGLVYQQIRQWVTAAGGWGWLVAVGTIPVALSLGALLVWMAWRRERIVPGPPAVSADQIVRAATQPSRRFSRIGVALEAKPTDARMLAEAVALAKIHRAALVLMHVVEGAGSQWHGPQTGDLESRDDAAYLDALAQRLRRDLPREDVPAVETVLGYGDVPQEVINLSRQQRIDLLVLGGHGHKGPWDWLHGQTIPRVRHGLKIPIFAVRE